LLGLDVANASMYDGASAAAEAVLMARRMRPERRTVWLARSLHPQYRQTVRTYLQALADVRVRELPFAADGRAALAPVADALDDALCVVLVSPKVLGVPEDVAAGARPAGTGTFTITATTEPLALALVRSPGACGADIAVAEGQSFGLPV